MTKKKKDSGNEQKHIAMEKKVIQAVLHFLRIKHDKAFNHKQIAAGAELRGALSHTKLQEILETLADKGNIKRVGRGKYSIILQSRVYEAKLDVAKDGFGFAVLDDEDSEDIFIAPRKMGKALNGDRVKIRILRGGRSGQRREGEVVEIIERATDTFIGRIEVLDGTAFFLPDDPKLNKDFLIKKNATLDAKDGDKVLLKMIRWEGHSPEGEVIRVLGQAGENETEMHAILFQYGFDPEFPEAVEKEAEAIPSDIPKAEIKKRRDFRGVTTFTIDPPDAKDFDDALSFKRLENGNIEVGVHIADVSYYVKPGTEMDKEGFDRATSVYLVDRTVPMLPERLSNGLCSLKPNEDRLAFSAVFELDENGKLHKEWFGRTVIHSDKRFAYMEAQAVMDAGEGEYFEELSTLNKIAKIFQAERFRKGSIKFEDDEVKFELDDKGKPIRVYRKVRKDAHRMIEDWMLLANRRVCEFVYKLRKGIPLPFIYRIHDQPDEEKLFTLQQFVATLGYKLNLENLNEIAGSLNSLMTEIDGKPEQSMIQTVAIRTMAKAIYSTDNIGHYGLGFEYYSHFTSPIRRYPDLMVHRMLGKYLEKNYSGTVSTLEAAAKHCTNRERRAVEAERASVKFKQVEFLEDKIGQQFEGIVTGVAKWGIYVEITENRCEGMIGLHELTDDYYEVDSENYCVRGRVSGTVIRLGDKVLIEVKGTSIRNRNIDFLLIEHLESMTGENTGAFVPGPRNAEGAGRDSGKSRRNKSGRSFDKKGKSGGGKGRKYGSQNKSKSKKRPKKR